MLQNKFKISKFLNIELKVYFDESDEEISDEEVSKEEQIKLLLSKGYL